jgi:hypothetical protein
MKRIPKYLKLVNLVLVKLKISETGFDKASNQ